MFAGGGRSRGFASGGEKFKFCMILLARSLITPVSPSLKSRWPAQPNLELIPHILHVFPRENLAGSRPRLAVGEAGAPGGLLVAGGLEEEGRGLHLLGQLLHLLLDGGGVAHGGAGEQADLALQRATAAIQRRLQGAQAGLQLQLKQRQRGRLRRPVPLGTRPGRHVGGPLLAVPRWIGLARRHERARERRNHQARLFLALMQAVL
mmetsp:Transcript_30747/g.61976  ORF Transcript_30747/g.61976 Transcript_30747/m.61976 type:complete len:206 (+) Transcript_30747:350-967(+)